jgi:steroid delta-isomerase-like uncharacterized protein
MSAENKALAGRFHREIFERGHLNAVEEICAPEFVWRAPNMPPGMPSGLEGARWFAAMVRNAFSEIRITRDDTIAEADRVVDRWTFHGTHTGEFMGVPATGRQVRVTGIDIFRIANGRLTELWQSWDQLGMMQQLGVIPASGQ